MLLDNKPVGSIYYFVSWTSDFHMPKINDLLCLKEINYQRKVVSVTYIIHPMVIVTLSVGNFCFVRAIKGNQCFILHCPPPPPPLISERMLQESKHSNHQKNKTNYFEIFLKNLDRGIKGPSGL